MTFTEDERASVAKLRAWAEQPENLHVHNVRLESKMYGVVVAGVRSAYSISWFHERRWRVITFSVPGASLPPEKVCWAIAVDLFGFAPGYEKTAMVCDPVDPTIRGFAQPLGTERES